MPPARTGVADYSAALLPALRRQFTVEVNPVSPCDAELYHIGNNALHAGIYERALARPGAVVLHDALLQHLLLGRLSESEYVEEFVHNYGEWHRGLAGELYRHRARSAADPGYFEWPMLRRLCERSRAVIVHNPAAAEVVRRHAPEVPVYEIPHLWEPSPEIPAIEAHQLRRELGVPGRGLLGAVFGHLRETKRIHAVLRVFERLHRELPGLRLLLAGDFVSPDLARSCPAAPWLIRRPYLSPKDFWRYVQAADLAINLRYPTASESSGIAIRLMGAGKAVVLTAGREVSRCPSGSCLLCDPGPAEEEQLAAWLIAANADAALPDRIGAAARAHIRREHNLAAVAERYVQVLRRL
jgi:glycosyltransferase involved in cell wall biosynthesis